MMHSTVHPPDRARAASGVGASIKDGDEEVEESVVEAVGATKRPSTPKDALKKKNSKSKGAVRLTNDEEGDAGSDASEGAVEADGATKSKKQPHGASMLGILTQWITEAHLDSPA